MAHLDEHKLLSNRLNRILEKRVRLYKGLKAAARISTNDFVPPNRRTRNHHSRVLGHFSSHCMGLVFTTRLNKMTGSLISASESAEDSGS